MALALATRDLGSEGVETLLPEATESLKPEVYLLQGPRLDRVYTARTVVAHGRKSTIAKHPQVLRHSRLRNTELALDNGNNSARGMFALGEQLKDPTSDGISEYVECVHQFSPEASLSPV